jgi:hypothetical protein
VPFFAVIGCNGKSLQHKARRADVPGRFLQGRGTIRGLTFGGNKKCSRLILSVKGMCMNDGNKTLVSDVSARIDHRSPRYRIDVAQPEGLAEPGLYRSLKLVRVGIFDPLFFRLPVARRKVRRPWFESRGFRPPTHRQSHNIRPGPAGPAPLDLQPPPVADGLRRYP